MYVPYVSELFIIFVNTLIMDFLDFCLLHISAVKNMKHEAAVHSQLRHPNIVSLFAMVFEEQNYGVILEFMKYGDLSDFYDRFDVTWPFRLNVINDIALGMNYLHQLSPAVIHGDLKIQNILIGDGLKAKVLDLSAYNIILF